MVNKNKKNERGEKQKKNGEHESITDSRFEYVHSDPRFQNAPARKSKVPIDSRFSSMFSDKKFKTSSAPCDKRGRPKNKSYNNPLQDYYQEEDEEESRDPDEIIGAEAESESSDTSDDDEGMVIESGGEEEDVEIIPVTNGSTCRLAAVNLDWQNIKAEDLLLLMSSALCNGSGRILSVAVYPSKFGIKCMEEEAARGPKALLGAKNGEDDENRSGEIDDANSSDESDGENSGENESDDENSGDEIDDEDAVDDFNDENSSDGFNDENSSDDFDDESSSDEVDDERIREYELSKLRYYYAVIVCDSVSTAEHLYNTLDGVEIVRSSNKFDLRFIEDSTEFEHPPRETATELPANYEGLNFCTRALQLSKVESTYDEEGEAQRAKELNRCFNDDQLPKEDQNELIGSDDSDDEEEDDDATELQSDKKQKKIDKYRALLSDNACEGEDGNEDLDMEVTFNPGLEDLSKRLLEKKDKRSETVWEEHLRKKKEKKKERKNKSRHSSSDDESSDDTDTNEEKIQEPGDFFVEASPAVKKGKSLRKSKEKENDKEKEEEEASRAELELLLADDKGESTRVKGYNMKAKKPKGKKDKQVSFTNHIPDTDYEDPRFSALFKSSQYALDPTDPQFKRSAVYARQLEQKQRQTEPEIPSNDFEKNKKKAKVDEVPSNEKHEMSALLKSIKMKSKQDWLPCNRGKNARKDDSSTQEQPVRKKSRKIMF